MFSSSHRRYLPVALTAALVLGLNVAAPLKAADHGDAPNASNDQAGDIGDVYAFLDPNDNAQVILIETVRGFITAGENANFGHFDHRIGHVFELDITGDSQAELGIVITFSPQTARNTPQTATVSSLALPSGTVTPLFTAPTTISTTAATAPAQTVTTDTASSIQFFAGLADDPFFFDIPGFGRFVSSVLPPTSNPDPTQLSRGRDSFAGYNIMAIALRVPRSLLAGASSLGVGARTFRISGTLGQPDFRVIEQIDRAGVPAVNVALTPFGSKNNYNLADPPADAAGTFATGIVSTLTALGTNQSNINLLAGVAVTSGDLLRLNLSTANSGPGGGNNTGVGFPNGRRLGDDVIATLLSIITNGGVTTGDNVNASDVALNNAFPFLALPQQPREPGVIDDNTRN